MYVHIGCPVRLIHGLSDEQVPSSLAMRMLEGVYTLIYIYLYIYLYLYTHICLYMYVCIFIYVCMYVYI
jgi:hypothetical protein